MTASPLSVRRMASTMLLFAVLAGGLALATPAHGQGTNGMVPDPIAGTDLDVYARRLGLSSPQRLAADELHEAYLAAFRTLREREINAFLERSGNVMRSMMMNPDITEAKKALDDLDRIVSRIRTIDEGFFDRMQGLLIDEQAPRMERVRQLRERERNRGGMVGFTTGSNRGSRVDLSDVIGGIDLDPGTFERIDPLVAEYESRLTSATRDLAEANVKMLENLMESMQSMLSAAQNADENNPGRMFRAMRETWSDATADVRKEASRISGLNLREFRRWQPLLPEDARRVFRRSFLAEAYRGLERGEAKVLPLIEAAMKLEGTSAAEQAQLAALERSLRDRLERLGDQIMDLTETARTAASSPFGGRPSGPEREEIESLQASRDAANDDALAQLEGLLGAARLEAVRKSRPGDDDPAARIAAEGRGPRIGRTPPPPRPAPGTSIGAPPRSSATSADPTMPPRLTTREWNDAAGALQLDDTQALIAGTLHEEYLVKYETIDDERVKPLMASLDQARAWRREADDAAPITVDDIDALYAERRAVRDDLLRLETTLLDDVEHVVLEEDDAGLAAMPSLRRARQRTVFAVRDAGGGGFAMMMRGGGSGSEEQAIDLASLVDGIEPADDATRTALERAREQYETELIEILRQRADVSLETQQAIDRMNVESRGQGQRWNPDSFRRMGEIAGAVGAIDERLVALNRAWRDRLAALLPTDVAENLRAEYRRGAFPSVYADADGAEALFRAALGLDDLGPGQRATISELYADYRGPYEALCNQMVELEADPGEPNPGARGDWGSVDWQRIRERRNEVERLRFERKELNLKAQRRLAAVLNDEQRQRLGLTIDG